MKFNFSLNFDSETAFSKRTAETPSVASRPEIIVLLACTLFLIALIFTGANMETSRKVGKLSTVSNYDDIVYLNKAAHIYFTCQKQGLAKAAHVFFTQYLHAPFSVFMGTLGFSAFGYGLDRVYYALSLVVFTYVALLAAFFRRLPLLILGSLVAAFLAVPFATLCALEMRPDLMWATLLSAGSILWLGSNRAFIRARNGILFGLLLGIVLLTKPSTFAMSLIILGGSWILAAMRALIVKKATWRTIGFSLLWALGTTFLVCGWYWVRHAPQILAYFVDNSFGSQKDVWAFHGSLSEKLLYYFQGFPLQSNLGKFLIPFLLIYVFGTLWDIFKGRDRDAKIRGASLLWMLVGVVAMNSVYGMKHVFLAGSLYGYLLFGAAWYLARLFDTWRVVWKQYRISQFGFAALVLGLSWSLHEFPEAELVDPSVARNQKNVNTALVRDLVKKDVKKGFSVLFTQANPITPEFVETELLALRKQMTWKSAALIVDVMDAVKMSQDFDYTIVQDQNIVGIPGLPIPAEKWQPAYQEFLEKDPRWEKVAAYPTREGKNIYLYKRLSNP